MTLDMVDATNGNQVFLKHFMADFHLAQGNQTKVVAELQNGYITPYAQTLCFYQLKMDKGLALNNTWTFWLVGTSQLQKNNYH
jgi:hypothetical protein